MKLLNAIHKYDVSMFFWLLNTNIHADLVRFCRRWSKTGDGEIYVLIMFCLYWQSGWESPLLQAILTAFAIERPVYFVLKNSFRRNRPQAALRNFRSVVTPSDQFSFPSGHTSAAFMMATLLTHVFPALSPLLFLWAALVGFSRVVLGVHFPTDILVGASMGLGIAILSLGQVN